MDYELQKVYCGSYRLTDEGDACQASCAAHKLHIDLSAIQCTHNFPYQVPGQPVSRVSIHYPMDNRENGWRTSAKTRTEQAAIAIETQWGPGETDFCSPCVQRPQSNDSTAVVLFLICHRTNRTRPQPPCPAVAMSSVPDTDPYLAC